MTEQRASWKREYPSGLCERVVQTRNCTCGESCGEYHPLSASRTCMSGCGSQPHGHVLWREERIRYAQPLSFDTCVNQTQGKGLRCRGARDESNETGTWEEVDSWCVRSGDRCQEDASLFLFETCEVRVRLAESPSSPPPPPPFPAGSHVANAAPSTVWMVAVLASGGFVLLSVLAVGAYVWYERKVLRARTVR